MANLILGSSKLKIARKENVAGIYAVTAHVKLHLNSDDIDLLHKGVKFIVRASLWGADGGANGGDNRLVQFKDQSFHGKALAVDHDGRILTFQRDVVANLLDEDSTFAQGYEDDVYALFNLYFYSSVSQKSGGLLISTDKSGVLEGYAEDGGKFK